MIETGAGDGVRIKGTTPPGNDSLRAKMDLRHYTPEQIQMPKDLIVEDSLIAFVLLARPCKFGDIAGTVDHEMSQELSPRVDWIPSSTYGTTQALCNGSCTFKIVAISRLTQTVKL